MQPDRRIREAVLHSRRRRAAALAAGLLAGLACLPAAALTGSGISAPDTLDSRPPVIALLHPLGGEEFTGASDETLRFTVAEDCWEPGAETLRLRVVDGGGDLLLVDSVPAPGEALYAHPWDLPDLTTHDARMVVSAVDRFGWAAAETSGAFTILHSLTGARIPGIPSRDELAACYPNPFNPATSVPFALRRAARVELSVFDLRGRRLAVLAEGVLPAGRHVALWNGRDAGGRAAASGTYLARLRVQGPDGSVTLVQRMTLLK